MTRKTILLGWEWGRTVQRISPDSGTYRYEYDPAGNVLSSMDTKSIGTQVRYDLLRRPVVIDAAGQIVQVGYDQGANAVGRVTSIGTESNSIGYQYDALGRIVAIQAVVDGKAKWLTYGYDGNTGRVASIEYPSGNFLQLARDGAGKVTSVTLNGRLLIASFAYEADGKLKDWTFANGDSVSRRFDADSRLAAYSRARSTVSIAYDLGDRIVNLADSAGPRLSQSFAYDNDDRLTTATTGTSSQHYQYDPDGNRSAAQSAIGNVSYFYTANGNRLLEMTGAINARFTYDAHGNVLSDGAGTFSYDSLNRLSAVTGPGTQVRYAYDGLGRRVSKSAGATNGNQTDACPDHAASLGAPVVFAYDAAGRLIGEYSRTGTFYNEYVWMGNTLAAVIKKPDAAPPTPYYIHPDHLGAPRQVTDANGTLVWEWNGLPFGNTLPNEDPGNTGKPFVLNLRYPGQYFDRESGLYHNGARDYLPAIGRYVQSDPIGLAGGINTYSYVNGNPINYTDPEGLWSVTVGAYAGAGGQMTFGNDGGNGFMTIRVGFGLGGGVSYNPNGGIPGPVPQDPSQGGAVLSCSAKANFNAGPLSAYLENGVARNYSNSDSAMYGGVGYSARDRFTGIGASGSIGGQITIYSGGP